MSIENIEICFIIGTRPQYVKFKPIHDYLRRNKYKFFTIDTNQHYSDNMSKSFIKEFNLQIDYNLHISNINTIDFISKTISGLYDIFIERKPSIVVVMGDTNTTLCGAIAANKIGLPVAHIEAGMRCGDKKRPEEMNRVITDYISDIHFTSRIDDNVNVSNPIYTGDLEITLLNEMNKNGLIPTCRFEDYIFMTIHRDENVNVERMNFIFQECKNSGEHFIFPLHHRTRKFINQYNIDMPNNIKVVNPFCYTDTVNMLSACKAIVSDSGGILKTSAFFGKKCLVPLKCTEYPDLIQMGYAKLGIDFNWLLKENLNPDRKRYYVTNSCSIICDALVNNGNIL